LLPLKVVALFFQMVEDLPPLPALWFIGLAQGLSGQRIIGYTSTAFPDSLVLYRVL
jgi:hypothetical protein